MAWYASPGGLEHPWIVNTNTRTQRADLDMVQAWLDECCEEGDTWAAHSDLYRSYAAWCKDNGVQPKSARGFTLALRGKGFANELKRADTKVMRVITGIHLA